LCNGWIKEGTTIIESSSGSTAVSEAYFARLLGLPFIAVMPPAPQNAKSNRSSFTADAATLWKAPAKSTPPPKCWPAS
jgi:cysteine synthase